MANHPVARKKAEAFQVPTQHIASRIRDKSGSISAQYLAAFEAAGVDHLLVRNM